MDRDGGPRNGATGLLSAARAYLVDLLAAVGGGGHAERARRERLLDINRRLTGIFLAQSADVSYEDVLDVVREALASPYGYLAAIDERDNFVWIAMPEEIRARCGMSGLADRIPRERWGGIWGRSLLERRSFRANGGLAFPAGHVPLQSVLVVPIILRGELIGQIAVADKRDGYTAEDARLLETIAEFVAPIFHARRQAERRDADRRRTEEALRNANDILAAIIHASPLAIFTTSPEGIVRTWNRSAERIFGWTADEAIGHMTPIIPDDRWEEYRRFRARVLAGEAFTGAEIWRKRKDGAVVPLGLSTAPVRDADGAVIGIMAAMEDITERKRAEEERARLSTAIEQAAEIVVVTDADGVIQYANPAFASITGWEPAEVIGGTPRVLKSGTHDEAFYRELWTTIAGGRVWRGGFTNRKKDGTLYREDATISPIRDRSGAIVSFVKVARDITDRVAMETQLRQAQKMEAVGRLAGGIAHDFNNLLQVIDGYTQLAFMHAGEDAALHGELDQIAAAAQRAATLVRQLLAFSRRQTIQPRDLDLNRVIADFLRMLRRVIGEHIALDFRPATGLWTIHADPGQIEQALMNLCMNARDAMPGGGSLAIETANATVDRSFCEAHPWARIGEYARITVSDTGIGMDAETQARVFEPFFTTKEIGHGTGLGLATVYGIVKQHDGMITVYSEPGRGTTFRIYLPAVDRPPEPTVAPAIDIPSASTRGGTILLAEDDEHVRALAVRTLAEAGYEVLVAGDGIEAELQFCAHHDRIDLCILDVVLPGRSGPAVCETIRAHRPEMPVLFCSGYSFSATDIGGLSGERVELLQKPYSSADLVRAARRIIEAPPHDAS